MKIHGFHAGCIPTNCYIVENEECHEAVVIDVSEKGAVADDRISKVEAMGVTVVAVLITHGHYDHMGGLKELLSNRIIPVYAGINELETMADSVKNCSETLFRRPCVYSEAEGLRDGQHINLAGFDIEVIETPGHTSGGVCYYFKEEASLFSGDTLFYQSVGRTDLPGGREAELIHSIREKLFNLPDDTKVYPGHGFATFIGDERVNSPYAVV